MQFSRILAASVTFTCVLPFAALAQTTPPAPAQAPAITAPANTAPAATGNSNAPVTRGELPALIKETLMNDPEMIVKAVQKMREKQMEDQKKQAKEALAKYK